MPVLATVGGASSRGFGEFRPASAGGSFIVATGGTTADDGNYRYHTFNSSGTFSVSAWPAGKYVDFLLVGGGGGGGDAAGGGGGVVIKQSVAGSAGSYAVDVGAGGGTLFGPSSVRIGTSSVFLGNTAIGGGGGGLAVASDGGAGGAGGSGGGGVTTGGAGLQPTSATVGLGNAGAGIVGGGGGAGAAASGATGGAGYSGSPLSSSLFGAGGSTTDGAGTANTGNGGGALSAGGSGIVIIRYLFQ